MRPGKRRTRNGLGKPHRQANPVRHLVLEELEHRLTPSSYTLNLVNNTGLPAGNGSNIQILGYTNTGGPNNGIMALDPTTGTFQPPTGSPSSLSSFPLSELPGGNITLTGNLTSARIVVAYGAPFQLPISAGLVTGPSPNNSPFASPTNEPYDIVEFTLAQAGSNPGLFINTSQVDQFGMPITVTGDGQSVGVAPGVNRNQIIQGFKDYVNGPQGNSTFAQLVIQAPSGPPLPYNNVRIEAPADVQTSPYPWATYLNGPLQQLFENPPGWDPTSQTSHLILQSSVLNGSNYVDYMGTPVQWQYAGNSSISYRRIPTPTDPNPTITTVALPSLGSSYNYNYQPSDKTSWLNALMFTPTTTQTGEFAGPFFVFEPLWQSNSPAGSIPSWITSAGQGAESPGQMVLAGNGVFADQGSYSAQGVYTPGQIQSTNTTQDTYQLILANLENQLVAALNRGVANVDYTTQTSPALPITNVAFGSDSGGHPQAIFTTSSPITFAPSINEYVNISGLPANITTLAGQNMNAGFSPTAVLGPYQFTVALNPSAPTSGSYAVTSGTAQLAGDIQGDNPGKYANSTWYWNDATQYYPSGAKDNLYAQALHDMTVTPTAGPNAGQSVSPFINQQVYAISYDDQGGHSPSLSFPPSASGDTVTIALDPWTAPAPPANLTAVGSNAAVTLSWDNVGNATSYNIYRGTSSGSESSTPIATVQEGSTPPPVFTYTDTSVTNGTTYYYVVKAVNSGGASSDSNEASATPTANSGGGGSPSTASGSGATSPANLFPLGNSANAIYVENVYQLLLNRAADPGAQHWVDLLNAGASPASVVKGIEGSPEYLGDVVEALYRHYLGRAADPDGLAAWTGALAGGKSVQQVTADILASPEYFNKLPSPGNAGFVASLYQKVLGRTASAAEIQNWVNALNSGSSRAQVAMGVLTSEENLTNQVNGGAWTTDAAANWAGYYGRLLRRSADPSGLAAWVNALTAGMSDQTVLADILGSPEGYADWS